MPQKQLWKLISLGAVVCLAVIATVVKSRLSPAPAPDPLPLPSPSDPSAVAIARQNAKLILSDGRTATFRFASSGGSLQCAAAVGLDQVLAYDLVPQGEPPLPAPPAPNPNPAPRPAPTPSPAPTPASSTLRVLLLYDPAALIDMPPGQQAILASPELRSYLDKHCPLESGCASGACPLTAAKTASYRFLPISADLSRLSPVWQQTCRAAAGKPSPWLLAVNPSGQTVIDQPWPASVEETIKLLQKFGGE